MPTGARVAVPRGIVAGRVIAIARGLPGDRLLRIATGLAAGGVRAFEITLNSAGALDSISTLAARFDGEELLVGAGTVLTPEDAQAALDAGARFIVMPNVDPEVIAVGAGRGIPTFPGVFTPSEALLAWRAGASAVKLFPASAAGPAFVRELRGPLPEIPVVPTGGITIDNAPAFIAAGAVAIGIGSWLTGSGDPDEISRRGASLVAALRASPA
jgi:2-dehydro-3-deoxyphosphogluconate aldolase/(4S)-4-hydroxy-2-oxoglutarate aldolase